jgi:hypothetical protein
VWFNIHKSINVIQHVSRIKDKHHIIILIDAEKYFDKSQYPFMIKALKKLRIEKNLLQYIKSGYDKTMSSVILNGENSNQFLQKQDQDNGIHFPHSYSIKYWSFQPKQ